MAALYQEFRPRRFCDLKGQDGISRVLKNQVIKEKPANAYLFSGPRGTGKTSSARILAMALNCLNPDGGEPCLTCEHCKSLLQESFIDVVEIDAASNTGVDHARELRENVNLLPLNAKYKIYIIDEVHMLTGAAFNALLKTIEEPPTYAVFILATTELRKVLPTVISRCQRFDFKPINHTSICEQLTLICDNREVKYEQRALDIIADAAGGGLRDALTILDQCLAASEIVDVIVAQEVLGLAGDGDIFRLAQHILAYEGLNALELTHEIMERGITAQAIAVELAQEFERRLMQNMRTGEPSDALVFALERMMQAEADMKFSLRPALVLEWNMIKLLMPEQSEKQLGARIAKIESDIAGGNFTVSGKKSADTSEKSTEKSDASAKKPNTSEQPGNSVSSASIDFSPEAHAAKAVHKSSTQPQKSTDPRAEELFKQVMKDAPPLVKPFLRWCAPLKIKGDMLIVESDKDVFALEAPGVAKTISESVEKHSQGEVKRVKFRKRSAEVDEIEEIL